MLRFPVCELKLREQSTTAWRVSHNCHGGLNTLVDVPGHANGSLQCGYLPARMPEEDRISGNRAGAFSHENVAYFCNPVLVARRSGRGAPSRGRHAERLLGHLRWRAAVHHLEG